MIWITSCGSSRHWLTPGPAPEAETVTLLNASLHHVDLVGWSILDRAKHQMVLHGGVLAPATASVSRLRRRCSSAVKAG